MHIPISRYITRTLEHRAIGGIGDGEHVWRHLMPLDALVLLHDLLGVDRQLLVRIDDHAKQARVRLQHIFTHIRFIFLPSLLS